MTSSPDKEQFLKKAIAEYEYAHASHYEKSALTLLAREQGALDFDYHDAERDVELAPDGAWVMARVWVPRAWMH